MKGLGHIPDHAHDVAFDLKVRHAGQLVGNARAPLSVDYSNLAPVVDQGMSSSCVGQAFATACFVRAAVIGHEIPRPSPKFIYDVARLMDDPQGLLIDEGTRPAAATRGMQRHGLVDDARWPLTTTNVNVRPPLDCYKAGLPATLSTWYRIPSGAGAAQMVRQALAKGHVPAFAMQVDDAYEGYDGSAVYAGPQGKLLGGHMQCLCGYGEGYLIVVNSWGRAWGRNGFARIDDAFLESSLVSDILVLEVVPEKVT